MEAKYRARLWGAAALLSGGLPAWAQNPPPPQAPAPAESPAESPAEPHELNGVTVKGYRDLMSDSDRRLKALKDSLPNLDSDGLKKRNIAERTVDNTRRYLTTHSDPNTLNQNQKAFIDATQNSIDREHQGPVPPPPQPDAKDYSDPLCQAGSCPP